MERNLSPEIVDAPLSHVALVMDGNRRWARSRDLPIIEGHIQGRKQIELIVNRCEQLGVKVVTFYAFSIDNLSRPKAEVEDLFDVFRVDFPMEVQKIRDGNVIYRHIGDLSYLPDDLRAKLGEVVSMSADKNGVIVNLALAYTGRDELKRAFIRLLDLGAQRDQITEEMIGGQLDTSMQLDPDLIIRTGGRFRLSNFLTWQGVNSEMFFTDVLWPDFTVEEFDKAIMWYQQQSRTFGR